MSDMMIIPFDKYSDDEPAIPLSEHGRTSVTETLDSAAIWIADICYVSLTTCGFIASTLLMMMGVPLIVLLIGAGGDLGVMAALICGFAEHFQKADPAGQQDFADTIKCYFTAAILIFHLLRMPAWFKRLWAGLERKAVQ